MASLKKLIACVVVLCAVLCVAPGLAMADDDAPASVSSVISTAWGSYEGCTQWLGVNAEVAGADEADQLTFFLTASPDGTEADLAAEGLSCTCAVADLPERKAGVHNAGYQGQGFLVADLPAGQYWLGCKLESGGAVSYAAAPRSFTVYPSLADFAETALERTLACSRHDYLISTSEDGARKIKLGSGGDYGDDWEAWMIPALVSGGSNPLFTSFDATAYLTSLGNLLDRELAGETNSLSLKDFFRFVTALCAVGEDPRDFHGYNLVEKMMEKASAQNIVAKAKSTDPLFLSYFLLACKIACVTDGEGFSVADEAACYEGLLYCYEKTVGTGNISKFMSSDNYTMSMLPLCFPVNDAALQARVDAAKQQMLDAYADYYQYGNGAISYGQPAADNSVFAQPNANSSAVFVNTFVFAGLGVEDLASARWQKPYGSFMSAWMTQMNDNGWMTYAGNPADNDMATYQTLGALVDLHNGRSCFAIASERYLKENPGYAAERFNDVVAALPEQPGLDDEDAVVGARALFERLTSDQRGYVERSSVFQLQKAEAAIAKAKEAAEQEGKYHQLSGTVYLSISHDGRFAVSDGVESERIMAYVPIDLAEVSKVDLDDCGLGHLKLEAQSADADYRYETTVLQLFVYASERFSGGDVEGMEVTGNVGSVYLKHFFGFDENFMYFVNGAYPLAGPGWGATCESVPLADGDFIDVAHFTDWSFYSDAKAGFHYFTSGGSIVHELDARAGEPVELGYMRAWANAGTGGDYATTLLPDGGVALYAKTLYAADVANVQVPADGTFALTFDEPGDYYVWADGALGAVGGACEESVVSSPAYLLVHVSESQKSDDEPGGDGSGAAKESDDEPGGDGSGAAKKVNPLKVSFTAKKTVSAKKLKKAARTFKAVIAKKAQGKVTYKLTKVSAKKKLLKQAKKKIRLIASGSTGKIKLKKGLKKGTYKLTVRVCAAGDAAYKPAKQTVTIKLRVK